MASYKELNEELEQMKAEFLTLHSEEEEREFGEKMERFVASKSPEDRKILAQAFVNGAKESCERAEKLYDETLRVYLEGIYESISWSYVARHYFGKSRSWLCQRINGLKIRNKEVQFTENEKKILLDALLDLSNNIKRTALVIGHLCNFRGNPPSRGGFFNSKVATICFVDNSNFTILVLLDK